MAVQWHVIQDGLRHGPYTVPDLQRLVALGVFVPASTVEADPSDIQATIQDVLSGRMPGTEHDAVGLAETPVVQVASTSVVVPRRLDTPATCLEMPPSKLSLATEPSTARQWLGLHPLVALGALALNAMLFGGELETAGLSWVCLTLPAALVLIPVAAIVQRYAFRDHWAVAGSKAVLLGVLTVIPTHLPAMAVTALASVVGGRFLWQRPPRS